MDTESDIKTQYPEHIETIITISVPKAHKPERLDVYLTRSVANATRTKVQKAIDEGLVTVNEALAKASQKVKANDQIICKLMKSPPIELIPEELPLEIFYEDEHLLVVNKAAGMCTHPGYGNRYGTLVNGLMYHFGLRESIKLEDYDEDDDDTAEELDTGQIFASDTLRPGIVHRLDKDTSGLLVIAKNDVALANLSKQFADRTTERHYYAIVWGIVKEDHGVIENMLGRSSRDRKIFAVVKTDGRYAKTEYEVIERFHFATLVKLKLHTGRTHQIRVHMNHIKHPIFGDTSYGGDKQVYTYLPEINAISKKCLKMVNRQLLHAKTLGFSHPVTKEFLKFESELPVDIKSIIQELSELGISQNS
jgi:23S rRNA pseudouridine1911/1915/1917 synthase